MGMKRKVGTVLDEEVFRAVKVLAARENRPLSEVIEEALRDYLRRKRLRGGPGRVRRTKGALPAPQELVRAILAEEEGFLGE